MSEIEYTISIANTNTTINRMHELLCARNIKAKRNDLKEVVSSLLSLDSSNTLDKKLKEYREKQQNQAIYAKNGQHKLNQKILLKSFNNAIQTQKFFDKHRGFKAVAHFYEDFDFGYKYTENDILFAPNQIDLLKTIFNWEKNAKICYSTYEDDWPREHIYDGYWSLELTGKEIQPALGENIYASTHSSQDDINDPNTDIAVVTAELINELVATELPFFIDNRNGFASYLKDCIQEDYAENYKSVSDTKSYIKYIERYLPYLSINEIVSMEVGSVPIPYLDLLHRFGARFDEPKLMIKAAYMGSIETCQYLLKHGNSLQNFYHSATSDSSTTYIHDHAYVDRNARSDKNERMFFEIVKQLEININYPDYDGNTPLHHCAICANEEFYNFLVSLGADPELQNCALETPAQVLKKSIHSFSEAKAHDPIAAIFGNIFADTLTGKPDDEDK